MKTGIITVLINALVISFGVVNVYGYDVNCKNAWASATAAHPATIDPKTLGNPDKILSDADRNKMNDLEEGWGLNHTFWFEEGGNFNYILCYFESTGDTQWSDGTARFKAKVDSGNAVTLWGWDGGGSWDELRTNEGGNDPGVETSIDIGDYIIYDETEEKYHVILLMSGYNPGADNEMWCDVCDCNINP